jgi:hypothetical protein
VEDEEHPKHDLQNPQDDVHRLTNRLGIPLISAAIGLLRGRR